MASQPLGSGSAVLMALLTGLRMLLGRTAAGGTALGLRIAGRRLAVRSILVALFAGLHMLLMRAALFILRGHFIPFILDVISENEMG
jgi:hypothetical protein